MPIIILLIGLFLYLIPSIVANQRNHNNEGAICILNLLLGWTLVGWVLSLVWACTDNVKKLGELK